MQRFRQNQTDTIQIQEMDSIRRNIAMVILSITVICATIFNTYSILTGASITGGEISFVGYIIASVCFIAFLMLYFDVLSNIALYLPSLIFLAVLIINPSEDGFSLTYISLMIVSAIIIKLPVYIFLCLITGVFSIYLGQQTTAYPYFANAIIIMTAGGLVAYVVYRFENITNRSVRINTLLQTNFDVGQSINQELELQQLLDNTVNTIRDEFDFYHVQVFLIDNDYKFANLVASTGEAGRQLLARNHRLAVGSQSVIGRVSQVPEPIIAQDTGADTVHANNELLPETRSELALPLIDGGQIIGALDVQSVIANAFQPIDIQALQIIANQLAVAIRNARLFEQAQYNIQENKRLLFEYETNLREVDRLNRSLTQRAWDNYVTQSFVDGVTLEDNRFVPKASWSPAMQRATAQQQVQTQIKEDENIVTIPIILRGQALGAIEVVIENAGSLTDTVEMIQAISQRLAISLESARLFEETQEASLQEQQINEIVSSYETALTIDELLHVTLEQLQQSLGAEEGIIRLGITESSEIPAHHNGNGNGGSPT